MADVAVAVLRVVAEIRNVAERFKENDRQAWRLYDRVTAIESPVIAVKDGSKMSSSESLHQLLLVVEEIRNFLEGYARTTNFNRALKRKANADNFAKLSVMLTEGMHPLQLDIAVDAWTKEDASNRVDDLENMVDIMERTERKRTDKQERPEGFEPVVVALANVVSRVGDPRHHGATAMHGSSSSGPNVYGDAPSVAPSMARLTVGGEVEASGLTDFASQPAGADSGTSADERNALLPTLSGGSRGFSALGRKLSRRAANRTGGEHMFAPSADLPMASEDPLPSAGSSRLKKKLSKMFGQTLSKRHEEEELLNERPDQLDLEVAKELHVRAEDLRNQGKYDEAAQFYLRATEIWENILGRDDPLVATALNNRAGLLSSEGKYAEAERLYARAQVIYEKSFGSEHPHVATALNNWALLLSKQDKYWEADPLYLRAIEIGEKALGPDHPDLGTWLNNRAVLLDKQEQHVEAIPLFERALSIRTRKLGGNHPDTAGTRNGLDVVRRKARLERVRLEDNPLAQLLEQRPST
ncbi:unnamed protein product [Ectocarpus sp. 4 AP-2014]